MRKCDICDTVIPIGSDRCPNCGYCYKPERRMSQSTRNEKKVQYMSQFQPHPSPLDEVKKKVDQFDFTKFFSGTPKTRKSSVSIDVTKKTKRIILIALVAIMVSTALPIIIGVFVGISSGITDVFNDVDLSFDEEYVYEWYDNYDELEINYPEYAKEVYPYRQYIIDTVYPDEYLYEDYNVDEDGLDYVYISGVISRELAEELIYTTIYVSHSGWEDTWMVNYSSYEVFDEDEEISPNLSYLDDLAMLSGISRNDLDQEVQLFVDNLNGLDSSYNEVVIDGKTFVMDYSDRIINYSITQPLILD